MDREKVLQALKEAQAEYDIKNLDRLVREAWEEGDALYAEIVVELIKRAIEILFNQHFLWVHIVESEDCVEWIPDGWYSFVAVHPETGQCLTFLNDPVYSWKSASFRARIRSADDAVDAVMRLAELIEQNLKSRAVEKNSATEVMSMQLERLTYTEEQIKQAIEEAWQELLQEADAEDYSLEEYLEHYRKYWDDPEFPNDVPEIIMRAVERIVGRPLSWYCELVRDPACFTGEYSFVVVDPKTQKCLTYREYTSDGVNFHRFIHVAGTVVYYEDIVRLATKLLKQIQSALANA